MSSDTFSYVVSSVTAELNESINLGSLTSERLIRQNKEINIALPEVSLSLTQFRSYFISFQTI